MVKISALQSACRVWWGHKFFIRTLTFEFKLNRCLSVVNWRCNWPLQKIPQHTIILFVCHPKNLNKHCFQFLLGHFNSQEKLKTMLTQNFGETNKEHYGMLWYFLERSIQYIGSVLFFFFTIDASSLIKRSLILLVAAAPFCWDCHQFDKSWRKGHVLWFCFSVLIFCVCNTGTFAQEIIPVLRGKNWALPLTTLNLILTDRFVIKIDLCSRYLGVNKNPMSVQ